MMSRNWLPFTPGKLPIVDVRVGTRRYHALIDTGSQVSLIAPDVAAKLGLRDVGFQAIVGVTGQSRKEFAVELPATGLANVELLPCRAAVLDLKPLGLGIQIILGVNAFARRRLHFDFVESRVYFLE